MGVSYSSAQRGGGSGATGRRRAAILEQINNWVAGARWSDEARALELFQKVNEAPERFISPDPEADYREEASRIYGEIKAEYGLRTEAQAVDDFRDLEAQAEARSADVIDWHGHAEERARKRQEAPALRPEHSRHFRPAPAVDEAPATVEAPTLRHTRPLPAFVHTLPAPIKSLFVTFWVFATFDRQPTAYNHA